MVTSGQVDLRVNCCANTDTQDWLIGTDKNHVWRETGKDNLSDLSAVRQER
jgi:hypothetical protein